MPYLVAYIDLPFYTVLIALFYILTIKATSIFQYYRISYYVINVSINPCEANVLLDVQYITVVFIGS